MLRNGRTSLFPARCGSRAYNEAQGRRRGSILGSEEPSSDRSRRRGPLRWQERRIIAAHLITEFNGAAFVSIIAMFRQADGSAGQKKQKKVRNGDMACRIS